MHVRSAAYWSATTLIAFAFLSGGLAYLLRVDAPLRGMAELGYPVYFVTILGAWKLLGALTILVPRLPLLKEWAYAGIAFDLSGASASHFAMGQAPWHIVMPIALLGITAVSWGLRPDSRRLGGDGSSGRAVQS